MPFVVVAKQQDHDTRARALGVAARYEESLARILKRQAEVLGTDVDTLLQKLGPSRLAQLAEQIDWDGDWEAPLRAELARMTKRELVRAGSEAAEDLGFRAQFNVDSPQAIEYARRHAPELVREISEPTREAIRATIRRGYSENRTRDWIARELRQIVGLTERQAAGVQTMRRAAEKRGATPAQIDRIGERAHTRAIRQRAMSIARTEIIRTSNAGTQMAWQQAQTAGALPLTARRRWIAGPGERTCEICGELDKQVAGVEAPFTSTYLGKVFLPPAHPNCRCTVGLTFEGPAVTPSPAPVPMLYHGSPRTDLEELRPATADNGVHAVFAADTLDLAGGYGRDGGRVYRVARPADTDLIDVDEGLARQSLRVRERLEGLGLDLSGSPTGITLYRRMVERFGSEEAASNALREAGIRGMRWPRRGEYALFERVRAE